MLPVVRTFISLPAGIAGMPPVRFGVYTTIGCLPWNAALAAAGYAVGANWESIANAFHGPSYIIAAVVLLAIVIGAWRYLRRRPAKARTGDRPPGAHRDGTQPRGSYGRDRIIVDINGPHAGPGDPR
jgi:uncharacterized membrane protein YdjX (TVP38/TMEM64 family)